MWFGVQTENREMWNGLKTLKNTVFMHMLSYDKSPPMNFRTKMWTLLYLFMNRSHFIFIIYLFQLYMRWAMLPVNGFLQLEIYRHMHYMFSNTFYNFWSWLWLDRIQEYSLPYFLCHGSPPLSFGQADPPRSSKYWPCLDAAIPFSGFEYYRTAIASSWNWARKIIIWA